MTIDGVTYEVAWRGDMGSLRPLTDARLAPEPIRQEAVELLRGPTNRPLLSELYGPIQGPPRKCLECPAAASSPGAQRCQRCQDARNRTKNLERLRRRRTG